MIVAGKAKHNHRPKLNNQELLCCPILEVLVNHKQEILPLVRNLDMNMKKLLSKSWSCLICLSDEINQSQASVTQSQNINQDNIKRKTEEVKR